METKFAEISDVLWEQVEALLPPIPKGPRRGRPPIPSRRILSGIVYRLRTGAQRHILTDGRGVPLSAEITAANVHDKRAAISTVDAVVTGPEHEQSRRDVLALHSRKLRARSDE